MSNNLFHVSPENSNVSSLEQFEQCVSKGWLAEELDPMRTQCSIDDLRKIPTSQQSSSFSKEQLPYCRDDLIKMLGRVSTQKSSSFRTNFRNFEEVLGIPPPIKSSWEGSHVKKSSPLIIGQLYK